MEEFMADTPVLHNAIWVKRILEDLEEEGVPTAPILREAGLTRQDLAGETPMLPIEQVIAFFQVAAAQTGDSALALHLAERQNIRDAGLIAYVTLNEPTLHDALVCLARYNGVHSQAMRFDMSRFESDGRFCWSYLVPVSMKRRQMVEWGGAMFTLAARAGTGMPLPIAQVNFDHPRRRAIKDFERFFGGAVTFGAGENALYFSKSQLSLPVRSADPKLAALLRRVCEDTLARAGRQQHPLMVDLERAIADRLATGRAGIDEIAPALGMSRRTLARRLKELNTSYTATLEGLRRALADRYLTDSDLSVSEIGFLLGYSDTSTFSAAYRRWTGQTPGETRNAS